MWKCVSNCFYKTFHKGLFKGDKSALQTKTCDLKKFSSPLELAPVVLNRFSRNYGFCNENCGNFASGKKRKKNPNEKETVFLGRFDNNLLDALTWSGVFVLSYYFLQPLKRKQQRHLRERCTCPLLSASNYQNPLNYLINAFGLKPIHYVVPEVKVSKEKSDTKNLSHEAEKEKNIFEEAHQKVSGVLNNWLGVQHMQLGDHSKALEFFIQSADKQNAAGIFNLGICHEKGLGTSQDLIRAAELYQKATDLGHPKAMYNLGVFYARGLGAMEVDAVKARQLFTAAAQLGQKDAEKALSSESPAEKDLNPRGESPVGDNVNNDLEGLLSKLLFSDSLMKRLSDDDDFDVCFEESDSGVLDLSP